MLLNWVKQEKTRNAKTKDYIACFSDLDIFIKRYPRGKLYAVLNVNRKPFSEIGIDDLGLGTRALNSLFRHDKTAIKDVLNLSVYELLRFRGLGVKAIRLFDDLHYYDLRLQLYKLPLCVAIGGNL